MDPLAKLVVVQVGDSSAHPTLGGLDYRLLGVACIDQATPESGPQSAPCQRLCTTNGFNFHLHVRDVNLHLVELHAGASETSETC